MEQTPLQTSLRCMQGVERESAVFQEAALLVMQDVVSHMYPNEWSVANHWSAMEALLAAMAVVSRGQRRDSCVAAIAVVHMYRDRAEQTPWTR